MSPGGQSGAQPKTTIREDLALALQYLLPHRLLSRIWYGLMRVRFAPFKALVIGQLVRRFGIDLSDCVVADPDRYEHVNAFFTRALRPETRPIDGAADAVVSPADGVLSQAGAITAGRIVQAKGLDYGVDELLADAEAAQVFEKGSFATVYLSPRDYHRVHMPMSGRLRSVIHVPGRLFSVGPATVAGIPRLFARNERLVCLFDSDQGPFAVVLVGAILVSSIETVFGGLHTPPHASAVRRQAHDRAFARGEELGRFNMGSTVVVLTARPFALAEGVDVDAPLRMGQRLGSLREPGEAGEGTPPLFAEGPEPAGG